jgi:hypothetical protein
MVKNQAIFENFRKSMTENWQKSPVKYCFSPLVPGHINHLASIFKREVYEADKKNWDFSCFEYVFYIVCKVVQGLAVQNIDMSDEEFAKFLHDVWGCFNEVQAKCNYRCTNGETFKSILEGIMKSGWLLTIDFNSIGQVSIDFLVKVRMGMTDDEILADDIVAGGDDTLQSFPVDFDTEKYIQIAATLGYELSFVKRSSFEGCEFFSNRFHKVEGVWTFQPERFTKHVAKIRMTKLENLASSLASHMMNYVWNKRRWGFFYRMFMTLRKEHPDLFPLSFIKTNQAIRYKVTGCEVDC